jgi:hypothetical protein
MTRESTPKINHRTFRQAPDETAQARALGMLELLLSAQASALLHCVDETCLARLNECVERLRATHELSTAGKRDDEIMWTESSLSGLLRLLVYLQAEATESLNDAVCASHLQECVSHLMHTHRLSPDQLCVSERQSCH